MEGIGDGRPGRPRTSFRLPGGGVGDDVYVGGVCMVLLGLFLFDADGGDDGVVDVGDDDDACNAGRSCWARWRPFEGSGDWRPGLSMWCPACLSKAHGEI